MGDPRVAKYALHFIGGKPAVARYYNDEETKQIDIMTSDSGVIQGIPTCATIGLSQTDLGLSYQGKPLRAELIFVCDASLETACQILATLSFTVMDTKRCSYGMVIPDVIASYAGGTALKHVVLLSPAFWPTYRAFADEAYTIAWLMAVPITDSEKDYIEQKGVSAFDLLLEEKGADVASLHRKPVV